MRIFFTGGTGKAGRHVLPVLVEHGHRVTNFDLEPLGVEGVDDLQGDVTDLGQVMGALTQPVSFDDYEAGTRVPVYDALVHFAAIPRDMLRTDAETYRINTIGTYNALEAAAHLGIRKVIFASSETTYGICFAHGERKPEYLPVDEEHPVVPEDSYAISKVSNEVTARSFQRRMGHDVYGLRINNVIEPHEYGDLFPDFIADPSLRRRNIFAYIDARDLGHMVDRCLKTDGLGYEVFNVANADPSVAIDTDEIARRFYEGVPMRREMGPRETFYCIDKAREMVGFEPRYRWQEEMR